MKGRAKDRSLLSKIRGDFEDHAGITHKYGRKDDEFFFVIGYMKPSQKLNYPSFIHELQTLLKNRRELIQLSMKVSQVSIILYQQRTLTPKKCLNEWKFKLAQQSSITNLMSVVSPPC